MRAVVQRVKEAMIRVSTSMGGSIGQGLLVYLGIDRDDGEADIAYLSDKIRYLRIFADESGHMNLNVSQVGGQVLVVSAFTVQADARRGRRPTLDRAADPEYALVLYELFCQTLQNLGVNVEQGAFGQHMHVTSLNDGPVCVLLDSRRAF